MFIFRCGSSSCPLLLSFLFVVVLSVVPVRSQPEPQKEGKLLFAQALYRHGDRTPLEPYPNDPWKDPSHWTTEWGQLTNTGKQRHLELGRWLRNRYRELLSATYSKDDIYVRSTDIDRTIMSAQANLAGLYPPVGADVWDSTIQWQPIPVHTVPVELDTLLQTSKFCPAFEQVLKQHERSVEFQAYNQSLESLYRYLTTHTGSIVNSPTSIQSLHSNLHIEELHNFTLPEWTWKVYPQPLWEISARAYAMETNTTPLARFKVGPLIKELLTRFEKKLHKKLTPNRSLWVYSVHDITIVNLLNGLRLFDLHNPPFAACLMLELRQPSSGKPYISIYYKNTTAEPEALEIPNCGTRCPLHRMFKVYEDVIPGDWDRECQVSLSNAESNVNETFGNMVYIVAISSITIIVVMLLVLVVYWKQVSGYHNDRWYLCIDGS
ncbi:prostatic acid phosphatase-like [Toxorhynchites rutilus septentrionalis]|uniref:prostatic acid phosphatase-like n=1 Tax=Toxorhynchites rutilus septentrionalis TaxID=329112 RepID=UPI00247A2A2F|nr:prostatic acid phosphatase-like [Toxorhynchites rutilus septentrionalis]